MSNPIQSRWCTWLLWLALTPAVDAADQVELKMGAKTIRAWHIADVEAAQKEARESNRAIAWIASSPKVLEDNCSIALASGRGATQHAFFALADKAVLVFQDAYAENHQGPKIVDEALHTPDPHYTPPTVVFLDAELKEVLAKVEYEPNFAKRKAAFAEALAKLPN